MNAALFKADVRHAVLYAIARMSGEGAIAATADCLWQCTRIRSAFGPVGTNAAWVARQVFNEVIGERPYSSFIYNPEEDTGL